MLQKVRRWNSNNQISSCLLPALTSIISFCQPGDASTKWRREGSRVPAAPRLPWRTEQDGMSSREGRRGEKILHKRGVGNADLVPGRISAWKRRAGGSPTAERAREAAAEAEVGPQSAAAARTPPIAASAEGEASSSSPLRNGQQRFTTQHQLSAPALSPTLVLAKFGDFTVQELFPGLFFCRGLQYFTKVIYGN